MFCPNCGTVSQGDFCGACGARLNDPQNQFANAPVNAVGKKSRKNVFLIIASAVLAISLIGSVTFTVTASLDVTKREVAISKAVTEIASLTIKAEGYDDDVESSSSSRSSCFVNWYCSASTYRLWNSIVEGYETLASTTRAKISTLETTKRVEQSKLVTAQTSRTIGLALSVLFGLGLVTTVTLLIVSRAKRNKSQVF
jgi:hypothetical protein